MPPRSGVQMPSYSPLSDRSPHATAYAVAWGDRSLSGLYDGIWTPDRGGIFGQIPRSQSVQQLATVDGTDPTVQVYALGSPLARDAYTVTTTTHIQDGALTASG